MTIGINDVTLQYQNLRTGSRTILQDEDKFWGLMDAGKTLFVDFKIAEDLGQSRQAIDEGQAQPLQVEWGNVDGTQHDPTPTTSPSIPNYSVMIDK